MGREYALLAKINHLWHTIWWKLRKKIHLSYQYKSGNKSKYNLKDIFLFKFLTSAIEIYERNQR